MARQISTCRNLKTIQAMRGQALKIDLGKTFTGTLTSWMKKDINENEYIEFSIQDNRYLVITKAQAQDLSDTRNSMAGKWVFDVRHLPLGGDENDERVIFTGVIMFYNNVTTT